MADTEKEKITLAVLSQQILTLTQEVSALRVEMRSMNITITENRIQQSRHDTEIRGLTEDYDSLSNRVNGWSALNSLGVIIAAIAGVFFGNKNP